MSSAVPRHRGPCLPADSLGRPQGFTRTTSPLSFPGVATRPDPLLSWASFPFRVLPSRSACRRNARPGPARTRTRPSLVRPRLADLARILRDIGRDFIFEHGSDCSDLCPHLFFRPIPSQRPSVGFSLAPSCARTLKRTRKPALRRPYVAIGGVTPVFWVSEQG